MFIRAVGGPRDELVHFIKVDNGPGHQYLGNQQQGHHIESRALRFGKDGDQQGQAYADEGRQGHRPQVDQDNSWISRMRSHPQKRAGLTAESPVSTSALAST